MPRRPKGSVPALVHHKPSNRARVRIAGREHWLHSWGQVNSRFPDRHRVGKPFLPFQEEIGKHVDV